MNGPEAGWNRREDLAELGASRPPELARARIDQPRRRALDRRDSRNCRNAPGGPDGGRDHVYGQPRGAVALERRANRVVDHVGVDDDDADAGAEMERELRVEELRGLGTYDKGDRHADAVTDGAPPPSASSLCRRDSRVSSRLCARTSVASISASA